MNECVDIERVRMNMGRKFKKTNAIYISAIFSFLFLAGMAHAQQKPPTQKELEALNAALKKIHTQEQNGASKNFPTREQDAEFSKISELFQNKYEAMSPAFKRQEAELKRVLALTLSCPLTQAHIQAGIEIHKKMRSLYAEHFTEISDWGNRTGRISCVRQAGKMKAYMIRLSDQWLAKTPALPLTTVAERAYAAYWIGGGGGFSPGGDPLADPKHAVGVEIIGFYGVCRGNKEYEPGTK